ncbi:MAG: hypothetical protein HQM10_14895 [Candidatus Riflebacteria bacterium]|nr:hypothetical protein [Candidatus Riflebacteria bacterium]
MGNLSCRFFKLSVLFFAFVSFFVSLPAWSQNVASSSNPIPGQPSVSDVPTRTVYIAVPPEEMRQYHFYLAQALHFMHSSYGFVAVSMRNVRKNAADDPMYLIHLEQLGVFIDQTVFLAEMIDRKSPGDALLGRIKGLLKKMKEAVSIFRESSKQPIGATEPDLRMKTSADIHDQIAREIPELYSELEKAMRAISGPGRPGAPGK